MLDALRLVRGSVSDKDLIPVLTHFHIHDGYIQGTNGRIAIETFSKELKDFNITIPADKFLRAVDACDGEPKLKVTEKRLTVSKGGFKAMLPLGEHDSFPKETIENGNWQPTSGILKLVRSLMPFISKDASRPWSVSILFSDGFAYATNNVVMAKIPFDTDLWKRFAIPAIAVEEISRIGQEPTDIMVTENAVLFKYTWGWLKSQVMSHEWQDVSAFIPEVMAGLAGVPDGLLKAVDKILPFCPDPKLPIIQLGVAGVSTADGSQQAEVSGIELPEGRYRAENLKLVLENCDEIDLTPYPSHCYFSNSVNKMTGIFVGMR